MGPDRRKLGKVYPTEVGFFIFAWLGGEFEYLFTRPYE